MKYLLLFLIILLIFEEILYYNYTGEISWQNFYYLILGIKFLFPIFIISIVLNIILSVKEI
jgi:hypothetical protein